MTVERPKQGGHGEAALDGDGDGDAVRPSTVMPSHLTVEAGPGEQVEAGSGVRRWMASSLTTTLTAEERVVVESLRGGAGGLERDHVGLAAGAGDTAAVDEEAEAGHGGESEHDDEQHGEVSDATVVAARRSTMRRRSSARCHDEARRLSMIAAERAVTV